MAEDNLSFFERRLEREIASLDADIERLKAEKIALMKQLAKARADREGLQFTTRKNSMPRVLAENAVIKALKASGRDMKVLELLKEARSMNSELKESTFRTYLNRMKIKGMIRPGKYVGEWRLP
jgi:chorismate mutase